MGRKSFGHLLLSLVLVICLGPGLPASQTVQAAGYPIKIVPDQMQFSGDVATRANCSGTVCSWLETSPQGSILLGVNPGSQNPQDWRGGAASVTLNLENIYPSTVLVLKITWPDRDGKGLHSPIKNRAGSILLDGKRLWDKRGLQASTFGDYYAAEHEPVLTTIVLNASGSHTLTFQVEPNTAWDISEITLTAYPAPTAYRGIGYSPYRDCQFPGGKTLPTAQDVQEDLFRLAATTNAIRTYSALGPNALVLPAAQQVGLKVFPGAWLDYPKSTTREQDDAETLALAKLACDYDVPGVIVGNEFFLRSKWTAEDADYLLLRIEATKALIHETCGKQNVPITTAEIDSVMFNWQGNASTVITGINPVYKPILDQVDFVMVHIYPYWSGLTVERAAEYTINRYKAMQAYLQQAYPGQNKWLIIGEAGWPSGKSPYWEGVPSEQVQRKYMLELLRLAEQENANLLYFDAFDELWKIEEGGGVGQRWGFSYTDRSAKHNFYGVLLPAEVLPEPNALPPERYLPLVLNGSGPTPYSAPIFTEWPEGPGRYVPSGFMGDIDHVNIYACDHSSPHSGQMAIKASFTPGGTLGWGGIMWQYPENNWGDQPQALDMSRANKVTFWARGEQGGERVRFIVGGIGTAANPYPDSLRPEVSSGFLTLSKDWQKYTINLAGKDLSHLIGAFGWATDRCASPNGATFYLDDIFYEYEPGLTPPADPRPIFSIYKNAADPANHYIPSGWMGDAKTEGRFTLSECWTDNPHSGDTAVRLQYLQQVTGWAGVYWVHPSSNWGDRLGGYDLRGAKRVSFWARSETPNLPVKFLVGGVGYASDDFGQAICSQKLGPYPDSVCPKIILPVALSPTWTRYTIALPQGKDFSRTVGAFGVTTDSPGVFYLDDIQYEWN